MPQPAHPPRPRPLTLSPPASRPARRPRSPPAAASPRRRPRRSRTRRPSQASSRPTTPGSAIARTAAPSVGPARSGTGASPVTSAVRTPESSAWCTQPPAPSASRTRRHWPYSAVISSGSPRRTNSQSTRWSRLGPRRALALSARIDTKRGSGRLVTGPRVGSAARRRRRQAARGRREQRSASRRCSRPSGPWSSCSRASCREVSGFLRPSRAIIGLEHNHNQCRRETGNRMPSARTRVVVTRRLPAPVEARMQELFDVTLNADDRPMTAEELGRALAERRRAGPDDHRPHRRAAARPGRPAAPADRQLRRRLRPHRRRHRAAARHHGHQHPGRPRRGHRRHGDGADPRGAPPAARRHGDDAEGRLGRAGARRR